MPSGWYNKGVHQLLVPDVGTNLETSPLKAMLLNTSHAFNRDHSYVSDIVANEITAVGYARVSITNPVLSADATADASYFEADNPVFGPIAAGQTIRFMVIYHDTGDDATSPLLMGWQVVDADTDGGEFVFEFSDSGVSKFWSAT